MTFWRELSSCEHFVQIYESEELLLATLESFVRDGLQTGDASIVIATPEHLESLEIQLKTKGLDLNQARGTHRYIPLEAEQTLQRFMVNGTPDPNRFRSLISELLSKARRDGQRVRAFGEMVALLWRRGERNATLQLEHLWHQICATEGFSLFCAYPKNGFAGTDAACLTDVCEAHSKAMVT